MTSVPFCDAPDFGLGHLDFLRPSSFGNWSFFSPPSFLPTVSPIFTVLLASLLCATAAAQTLPISYQIQLQVRADTGGTAFNLPNGSTFNSVTASVNDLGKVAVKVSTVGLTTSPGVWFGGQGTGALVYNANDNDAILSDTYVNVHNQVSFPRFVSTSPADDGLYVYDNTTGMTTRVTNGPLGATSYTNPQINDNGIIGLRIKFNTPQALFSYNVAANSFINYVTETSGDPGSRYSFLYAPAFNNNNRIAAEANINGQAATYKGTARLESRRHFGSGRVGRQQHRADFLCL